MSLRFDRVGLVHPNGRTGMAAIDLQVAAGERVALIGPSGAGKTTLLRVAAAGLRPSSGHVRLLDADPWSLRAGVLKALRARVGFVHQAPPIPPRLRVVTAVLAGRLGQWGVGRALRSWLLPDDVAGARDALARVGLADRVFDRCDQLSGGQLQRVAVARALYQAPGLLLADEPVSGARRHHRRRGAARAGRLQRRRWRHVRRVAARGRPGAALVPARGGRARRRHRVRPARRRGQAGAPRRAVRRRPGAVVRAGGGERASGDAAVRVGMSHLLATRAAAQRDPLARRRLGWAVTAMVLLWPLLHLAEFHPAILFDPATCR